MTGTGARAIARATISSLNAQILDGSAAAPDDDVDAGHPAELAETARDPSDASSPCTRRADDQVEVPVAAAEDLDDVADGGAVQGRDDADLARQGRQRPCRAASKSPFLLQAFLQLFKRHLERAQALRLQVLADDLILALRLVHRDPAADDDPQPSAGLNSGSGAPIGRSRP